MCPAPVVHYDEFKDRSVRSIRQKKFYFRLIYYMIGVSVGITLSQIQEKHLPVIEVFRSDVKELDINEMSVKSQLLLHNQSFSGDPSRLAKVLKSKVRILCWILTGKQNHYKRAQHIKATWVGRCNRYLFISSEEDQSLPALDLYISEGRKFLWMKTREAFKYIYDNYLNDYDWFLKADDDTYVIVENLRYLLLPFSPDEALHFGFKFRPYTRRGYHSGGAGYILSREALRKFVSHAYNNQSICRVAGVSIEDLQMGICLERVGVRAGDTRDQEGLYSPISPDSMISGAFPKWMTKMTYYNISTSSWCCSKYAVSFHYVKPPDLYMMEYLIYRVKVFGVTRRLRFDEGKPIMEAVYQSSLAARGPDETRP